jgi:hypothetical protein
MGKLQPTVPWRGRATLDDLIATLRDRGAVVLDLAPDFHHSLFVHLCPDASPGDPEQVDVEGGVDLLLRVAETSGLESLSELLPVLRAARAQIRVESPAPKVHIRIADPHALSDRS